MFELILTLFVGYLVAGEAGVAIGMVLGLCLFGAGKAVK